MSSALVALLSTLVVPLDTLVAAVRHPSGRAIRQLSTPVGELQDSVHIDTENVDRTVLGDLLPRYGQQTKLNQRREILFYRLPTTVGVVGDPCVAGPASARLVIGTPGHRHQDSFQHHTVSRLAW